MNNAEDICKNFKKVEIQEEEKKIMFNDKEEKELAIMENQIISKDNVRVSIIGNVDSGKSTLVGVLTKGIADDGRGSARLRIFNYPHEAENGRTSSIAHEIMGFNENGKQMLPDRFNPSKNKYWSEVVKKSKKIVTLLDLCGHEKYLKTTIFGLTGLKPDYSMIIVGSNMGISKMTKEHLGVTLALKIPFFVVLTKIDMCPEEVLKKTLEDLNKILKTKFVNRMPIIIKKGDNDEINKCAEALDSDRVCPIFSISSVNGQGYTELTQFISKLHSRKEMFPRKTIETVNDPPIANNKKNLLEFDIHEHFMVTGVGIVVSGLIKSGIAKVNQQAVLGPIKSKKFKNIVIKSIHVNRVQVNEAITGEFACFSIKATKAQDKIMREEFRKGMMIMDPEVNPDPVWKFWAEIVVLHHSSTIKEGYQAVVHCGVVRQAATVVELLNCELMRTNDKGVTCFKFMYHPECLKIGETVLLREGRTKILGIIIKLDK